jgi:hypothetical protein
MDFQNLLLTTYAQLTQPFVSSEEEADELEKKLWEEIESESEAIQNGLI